MLYQHRVNGEPVDLAVGKVVCVGRNYAAHAQELNNPVPDTPILFIKPGSAIVPFSGELAIPKDRGACHHELEMAVLIANPLQDASEVQVEAALCGYGLGLDLTLRDLQSELKAKGHPWEIAKSFDGSCPLSGFISVDQFDSPDNCELALTVNGEIRQQGMTSQMLTGVVPLIRYMSQCFKLLPGDVVLTGTPAGVAALKPGDILNASLGDRLTCSATIS